MADAVVVAVVIAAALAVLALAFYRPWTRTKRRVHGHELEVHVERDLRRMEIPAGVEAPYYFWIPGNPQPPQGDTVRWGNAEWAEWAYSHNGNDVTTSVIQVTIQGGGDGPVSVETPELVEHQAVPRNSDGAVYGPEGLGGNGIHSRRYVFTLDGDSSAREYLEDSEIRPGAFGIAKGETQRLLIVVRAIDDKRHLFAIDIPVIYSGRSEKLRVRQSSDTPFVIYGAKNSPVKMLVEGEWFQSPSSLH